MLKTQSLKARVAKKAGKGGWKNFDKKKIIESMGCQEREGGGKKMIKRKSLKAWVAKKGGGGKKLLKKQSLKARVAKKAGGGEGKN